MSFFIRVFLIKFACLQSQGERWRKLRSASNPIAARPKNVALFLEKHDEVARDFLNIIDKKFGNNSSVVLNQFEENLKLAALESKFKT